MYRGGRIAVDQVDLSPAQDGVARRDLDQPCSTKTAGTTCMIQKVYLLPLL